MSAAMVNGFGLIFDIAGAVLLIKFGLKAFQAAHDEAFQEDARRIPAPHERYRQATVRAANRAYRARRATLRNR